MRTLGWQKPPQPVKDAKCLSGHSVAKALDGRSARVGEGRTAGFRFRGFSSKPWNILKPTILAS